MHRSARVARNPLARHVVRGLSYESLRESHRSARAAANPLAKQVFLRFVQTSKRNVSLGEFMGPLARRIVLQLVISIPRRHASLGEIWYESLGKPARSARFFMNLYANKSFCDLSIPRCNASLGERRYESLGEARCSAMCRTSMRNVSLGEIVMSPLARRIVLQKVISIPRRRASLGKIWYESLGKPARSARFFMNLYANKSFCDVSIPRCNASFGERRCESLGEARCSAMCRTSTRNASLGEIVMNSLARCIVF